MIDAAVMPLKAHFSAIEDPRAQQRLEHLLLDIVLITICAVLCGADNWVEIENYGITKQEWLKTFLELPNGIPSHDTLERTFARLRPEPVQQCCLNWVQAVFDITEGQLINSDGKTLRGSDTRGGKQGMIHRVSAWAQQNRLVLGQRKVHEKSNEITAIPELLHVLDLAGAVVSIDAMGCQTAIAAQIVAQQGDYVLALKGNQGHLHQDVMQLFHHAQTQNGAEHEAKLTTLGCVESQRQVGDRITSEKRYSWLSLPLDAARFADSVRGHWGIENQLHWLLDVGFREDHARATQGYSAENLAVIRHLAVNLLTQEKTAKVGTRVKRLKAGWDNHYLTKVLSQPAAPSRK